ncbi:hypothetical protein GSI_08983 [Ganoderma sinense ZZ0214-1]|uniref:DUF6534 domain-containing protein n=1 Tax=Ganoderma sinense ZZ0214-1 TaxID=1077348 RepID=A0A2G8S577_9APHY|nr:hypothetical protein GSI_08983 [Ganoderma sinense ZZ0214-1]
MSAAIPPSVLAGIKETLGAAVVGGILATTIYGITVLQTYTYFRRYPNDSTGLKTLASTPSLVEFARTELGLLQVGVLFILDTVTTVSIADGLYGYMVTDFGRPDQLSVTPISLAVEEGVTVVIATLCQLFFAHRLWVFSKHNKFLTFAIVALALGGLGPGIAITIHLFVNKEIFTLGSDYIRILSGFANGLAAVCDIVIAAGLCWYLQTGRTGYKRTDNIVDKLIVYAINRGVLTTACQTAHMITAVAFPGHFYFIPFAFCLGKFYCNTVLATLNVRQSLRQNDVVDTALEAGSRILGSTTRASDSAGDESLATIEFAKLRSRDQDHMTTTLDGKM